VAYSAGQIPIFYNHVNGTSWHQGESIGFANYVDMTHTPRYYFGYGLSYTTFEYSDLQTDCESMAADGSMQVTLKVSNTGKVKGTDVVQMYVRDVYASMVRPEKELAGFERVTLEPGETKTVKFTLKASQTAFLTADMKWKVEKGAVDIMIGKSCNEILLSKQIQIENDAWIDGAERGFYARCEVMKS
jgi:beta-glucosidase